MSAPEPISESTGVSDLGTDTNTSKGTRLGSTDGVGKDEWWITFYDLVDRVWSVCTGVCEYAIGKGRIGGISLPEEQHGGDEGVRLIDGNCDGDEIQEDVDMDMGSQVGRGRMIIRQLYHNTHHLHQRLAQIQSDIDLAERNGNGSGVTKSHVRWLGRQWIVGIDDIRFWNDLARRLGFGSSSS